MTYMLYRLLPARGAGSALLLLVLCLAITPAAALSGGPYTLDWTDIPGGGSQITGGTYNLRSSAGQPDACPALAGGTYTLKGGFWTFPTPLSADINQDGYVNVGDLQALVAAWGSTAGPPPTATSNPAADINGDGYVNVGDLQALAAQWGLSSL